MLYRIGEYFHSLSPVGQATVFGTFSVLLLMQAVKRHQDQTITAFLLGLTAIVLGWFAFAALY